jgi:hypothetical protein
VNCKCNDERHDVGTALWHRAYCNWYDHGQRGRGVRARVWGWIADRLVRFAR